MSHTADSYSDHISAQTRTSHAGWSIAQDAEERAWWAIQHALFPSPTILGSHTDTYWTALILWYRYGPKPH